MSEVIIELNQSEIRDQILKSQDILAECEKVASGLGEVEKSYIGFDRAHVLVKED